MVTTLTVKRMYRLKRGKIHQQGDYNIAGPAPLSAFWNSTNSPCPLSNGVLTPAASPSRLSWSCCTSWSVGEITKVCNLSTDCVQTSDWMVSPWPFYKNRSQQKPPKHPLRHSFAFCVCVCVLVCLFVLFLCLLFHLMSHDLLSVLLWSTHFLLGTFPTTYGKVLRQTRRF